MPTVAVLREMATKHEIKGAYKMKKDELIEALGRVNASNSEDIAETLRDVRNHAMYKHNNVVFTKIWEHNKKYNKVALYVAVMLSAENKVLIVKGNMSKGLGLGGGKWRFEQHFLN